MIDVSLLSLLLHTLDFSSSSKMALGALGGGGGRGLSSGRTGSSLTIPGREQGHLLSSHANSPDFIHQHYVLYIRVQVTSDSDSELALFTKIKNKKSDEDNILPF